MKIFNLIKRLWTDSHEKQSPQRFGRYAAMLIMLLTLGVGQMWANGDIYGCWFSYSYSGTTGDNNDYNTSGDKDKDLGTLTADLIVTSVYLKIWDDQSGSRAWTNGQLCYTTDNWANTSYVGSNNWTLGSKSGNNYQLEKSSTSWTLASATGASGSYTLKYYWQVWGGGDKYLNNGGSNYSFTYKVAPPAVSGFTITPSGEGYVSGSGTSGDPYIIHRSSGNLTLTISGSQAHTDANSVAEYSVDGGSTWSTSVDYVTINRAFASTTAKSKTLKMRYKNSTASLTGTESSFTAYYKLEAGYTITKWGTTTGGSYTVPSSAGAVSGGTVSASPSTGYNFGSWSVTSGSGTWENSTSTASNKFYPTSNSTLKATFTAKNYTVTLDKNDGDSNGSIRTTYNSTSTSSFTGASRVGYSCDGYFTASDGGTKIINADGTLVNETVSGWLSSGKWVKNAATITLYAHWIENATNYTLHYTYGTGLSSLFSSISAVNSSDASAISDNASLVSGTGVTLTATPATHYRFDGWYSAAGCAANTLVSTNNPYSFTMDDDINLYAKAVLMTTTITLDANGGAGGTSSVTATHGSNSLSSSITKPTRTGYTLSGWYTEESGGTQVILSSGYTKGSVSGYTDASGNWTYTESTLTLYAHWTEQKKTLTPTVNYNGGATPSPAYTATSANTVGVATTTVLTASEPNAEHYTFAGWTLTNLTVTSGNAATDRIITVKITDYSQAISAVANYTEVLTSRWHLVGESSDFPDGWNVNSTTMMQKKTGHSTEDAVYFTVDVNSTDAKEFKIVDDNGASADIWYGYSNEAQYQRNWTSTNTYTIYSGSGNGQNLKYTPTVVGPYEFKVDYSDADNVAVTVTFPTSYTLTYDIGTVKGNNGSISTSPSTSSGSKVLSGTDVTLTGPAAAAGYTWKGWYTNAGGTTGHIEDDTRAITVTMNADKTLYACYTENNYTVTVNAGAGGSVASGSVTGHVSTKVTLPTATPSTGYYFTGWEVTSGTATLTSESSANAAQINGMTAAVTVRANFAPIWYLKGDFNSWGEGNPIALASATSGSVTLTTTSAKLSNSKFKIWNKQTDTYYQKANHAITRAANTASGGWTNGGTSNDMKFNSDVIGDYIFAVTLSSNIPSALTVTYPAAYTVTFGMGTGGSTITASTPSAGGSFTSGDYVASGADVTFTQTASSTGYTFTGWYTTKDTGGSAVTGMGVSDNVLENVTANKTVWSRYTANNYTVTFDKNGGTVTPSPTSKSVTFGSAYGELPSGMKHTSKTFVGWFTESSGGTLVTAETIVSTASNHTLYAQYEDVYSVNVDFKCGGAKIYPSTVVNASPTALRPTITAPEIFGYSFVNWTGDDVTPASATSATTTITATAATTITANYAEVPTVYFKNNLEWDSVFVSFDITWTTAGEKQVPNNSGKPYYAMKQIGTTDIYYCEIPSTYTASNYASWSANIAFDNQNYNHKATTTHTGNMTSFYQGEFTGRGDFDPKATLFIPYNGDTEARNGGTFYKTGCWMKYNSTESGYQLNMNEWVTGEHDDLATPNLTAPTAGGYEFSATVNLSNADYSYGFKLYKQYQKNTTDLWYTNTGTINASTESLPWHFWAGSTITETSQRCELHTEAVGDYKISVSFATGRPMVNVEYPTQVGDWRLAYNDRIAWSGDAHAADWYIYSRVIKAKADAEDLVSFYVSKAVGANAHIELQKCTDINPSTGAETWTKQGDNLDLSSITGTGIYNFKVTQNGSKVATAAYDGAYEGNFYIRTDASDGGWTNYISSGKNVMTYSEYAKDYSGFTHYYMRFVETGTNIKFCIANDYSPCLTEYCIDDDYTGEYIEAKGNVRYMWDHRTNKVSRAYISGSSVVSDRFLVLEGNTMIMAEDGTPLAIAGLNANEKNFADDQNWIYEATIKAKPTARVKLTAKFNNQVQYFKGSEGAFAEGTTVQLIGGTGDDAYKIRVIYDFKTNRLVGAWLPDDETVISSDWPIDADIMVLRYHQEGAKQIKFSGSGALSDVKTVYGAMQFNKYRVNNKRETAPHANLGLSNYERDLYWISFPFEVKLSDVFGFGTYGKHWIIEYYDGKTRAANGFWADSDPNWKFVTPSMRNNGYVLKANQGYVLALDLDNMTEESDVWAYGTENVYLYFPSTAHVSDIDAMDSKTISIDQTGYECTINRGTPDGDRRVKDSYWHVLGVPSYANASHETANAWTGTVPNIDPDNWTSSAPYIYEWVPSTNKYTVHSSSSMTFLPMHSYYAQYAQTTITWTNINATPAALVARRNAARKSNYEFRMEMTLGDEVADQTFVSFRDDEAVTNEFDFSYDLSKITNGSFAKTNCIYTLIGYERAAANCLPLETEATTIVPVGVNIATAGEYTIAIPSGTSGVGVTLVDNETGLRTNLALEDYTVALEAGTQDDRFYLEISPIKHVATDIENVQNDETQNAKARKVIIDQKMYIIKDGRVFDAQGARVK